jgi:ribonuclease HII
VSNLSIAEIETKIRTIIDDHDPFILELEKDERKGVQTLLAKWKKKRDKERVLKAKFFEMTEFERKYREQGFKYIAGVDEVGRGPIAGPVVAAAVILPDDFFLPGIDDSKKLSEKKRLEFDAIIRKEAITVSISMVHAQEIDEINIYEAAKKAMLSSIASLKQKPDVLLIDAMKLETPYISESIIKGDARSISIAAASIIAKTTRDQLMKEYGATMPNYGFEKHMGYGTKEHLQALKQYGITPIHRKSFAPVKDLVQTSVLK